MSGLVIASLVFGTIRESCYIRRIENWQIVSHDEEIQAVPINSELMSFGNNEE